MSKYRGHLEIYLGATPWDTDSVILKCNDFFGAIQELSTVINRLEINYGNQFKIRGFLREA